MEQPVGEYNQFQQTLDRVAVISLRGAIVVALSFVLMVLRLWQRF